MEQHRTHFLLVGDDDDIPMIRAILGRLPVDGYGQVIIEVSTPLIVEWIDAPVGVAITWLYRHTGHDVFGPAQPLGALAWRATRAWLAEWMPGDTRDAAPLVVWMGCARSKHIDALYWELRTTVPGLHLHHSHYDHAPGE